MRFWRRTPHSRQPAYRPAAQARGRCAGPRRRRPGGRAFRAWRSSAGRWRALTSSNGSSIQHSWWSRVPRA